MSLFLFSQPFPEHLVSENRFSKSFLQNEQSLRILRIELALLLNKYAP